MDGSKKDWKRMWQNAPDTNTLPSKGAADATEVTSRLLLWQPDGRAAAVVSSTSLDVLNVESGADIFHASLAAAGEPVQRVVDGVWVQLSAADGSLGADDRGLYFTDCLPPIPRFSDGGGGTIGEESDDDADTAHGEFTLASSSSAASSSLSPLTKPSLSLIAILDACGRSR
jgi:hypothetical protein